MTAATELELDRRKRRTRQTITDAFIRLIFTRRYDRIRTSDLIEAAGVGRSTFYEHFRSKDDVMVSVIEPLFAPLAEAAAGRGSIPAVQAMLAHFWHQRSSARMLFEPPLGPKLQRKLAAMIEARLDSAAANAPPALVALGGAAELLAILRGWLVGEAACPAVDLARHLVEARRGPAS